MSALIITPAVIARSLSNKFSTIIVLAIVANTLSSFIGTYLSYQLENPTGPWIIVVLSIVCFITIPAGNKLIKR